jgi:hypothetical protein
LCLLGATGVAADVVNAILAAAATNFHKLLKACEGKGSPIRAILDRLLNQSHYIGLLIALPSD